MAVTEFDKVDGRQLAPLAGSHTRALYVHAAGHRGGLNSLKLSAENDCSRKSGEVTAVNPIRLVRRDVQRVPPCQKPS
jgi:hypothetical protein